MKRSIVAATSILNMATLLGCSYAADLNNPMDPQSDFGLTMMMLSGLTSSSTGWGTGSGTGTGSGNPSKPDLQLVSFSPPSSVLHENSYSISATIRNAGQTSASGFYVSARLGDNIYYGRNACQTSSGTNIGVVQVASLAAGASTTVTIPLNVYAYQTTGINYIGICLDSGGHVTEYSAGGETNNYGNAVGTHIKQVTVN